MLVMNNYPQSSNYRSFATNTFKEIFTTVEEFKKFYETCGLPTVFTKEESITTLYYLLYARYANSHIANYDEGQFKYGMFSIIFQYGGTWEKELELQKQIRTMTIESLRDGGTNTYKHALNPGTPVGDETIMSYTNEMTTNANKKSLGNAYVEIDALLKRDVSNYFLDRFRPLFSKFAFSQYDVLYTNEIEGEEE